MVYFFHIQMGGFEFQAININISLEMNLLGHLGRQTVTIWVFVWNGILDICTDFSWITP